MAEDGRTCQSGAKLTERNRRVRSRGNKLCGVGVELRAPAGAAGVHGHAPGAVVGDERQTEGVPAGMTTQQAS